MPTITLNLPHDLTPEQWSSVEAVFKNMDGWIGYSDGDNTPEWFGTDTSPQYVWASFEPSGLRVEGNLEARHWTAWVSVLCARLTLAMQHAVHDAEMATG